FITTIASLAVSAVGAIIITQVLDIASPVYLFIGYFFIGVIDVTVMLYFIKRTEKNNIQKALKGSVL
ncbi:MAG: hypothetical protein K2K70_06795, partial [Lachnospiraceae bacterium]|nr:hypothetical protein [Lachnospiraceae bacterium]